MKELRNEAITDQQFAYVAIAMNTIKKSAQQVLWRLPHLAVAITVFLSVVGIEIAIAYGVFSGLLQGVDDPVVEHSAGLLSLTALIAMFTYHKISKDSPNAWPVRLIRSLSTLFAPLYVLAGGLFLGILLFPGAVATTATGAPDTIFGLPVEQVSADSMGQAIVTWLQENMVLAAPLFVAGVMGISVMGLFVGGECINTIDTNARHIFHTLSNYKTTKSAWAQLQADIKKCPKTAKECNRLEKRTDNVIRTHAAVLAAGQVNQFVQRAEAAIEENPALFTNNDEPDSALDELFGKQPDLSGAQARIDTLKTFTVKHIRGVIDRNLK
ncbi:MAG: hypothetical protein NMNS01_21270 [Nitrosomonas sp.]|nr:MAG: hypothetical protein NMNS01_21270 [Nitrosomonas sp.]